MSNELTIIAVCLVSGALGFGIIWNIGTSSRSNPGAAGEGRSSAKPGSNSHDAGNDSMDAERVEDPVAEEPPVDWRKSVNLPWYELLDVPSSADPATIRGAYLRKIEQYHPDRYQHSAPEIIAYAQAQAKALNIAFAESKSSRRR